jgi:DNA-binding transcriptional ArsR family regulator
MQLDDVVQQRVRLGILAILVEGGKADFAHLRDALGLTDGNLSRHLQVFEESGYVKITKTFEGKRPRTWIAPSKRGRDAFAAQMKTLKAIVERFEASAASADGKSLSTAD